MNTATFTNRSHLSTMMRYTLLTASRDYVFLGIVIAFITACLVSYFLGSTSLSEQKQTAITLAAGTMRLIYSVGLILFISFHIRRSLDNKEIEVMLTLPLKRSTFIVHYWISFTVLASLLLCPLLVLVLLLKPYSIAALGLWGVSLWLESMLVVAFTFLCALMLRSATTAVLVSFGFYVLARLMGFLAGFLHDSVLAMVKKHTLASIASLVLQTVSMVVPRLDLYGKTEWLVYGTQDANTLWFCLQTLIYVPLLLAITMIDFEKRTF